jgi:hypothetical protein
MEWYLVKHRGNFTSTRIINASSLKEMGKIENYESTEWENRTFTLF